MRALVVVAALLFWPLKSFACPGCSNPNLPSGSQSQVALPKGQWLVSLETMATAMNVVHESACPDIGPRCRFGDVPPYLHDQDIRMAQVRATVEYGLTDRFGLQLQVPFKVVDTGITYRRMDGTVFTPDEANVHHRNETLPGFTDPWLQGRAQWKLADWTLVARAGLTLPVGRTEADPFAAGARGEPHQHFQFGAGLPTALAGFDAARAFGRVLTSGYLNAQLAFAQNRHGFQQGQRLGAGLSVGAKVAGELTLNGLVDLLHETAERWQGRVQQDGNLGRTDVLAGVGASYAIERWRLSLRASTPVYQHVIGGQLSYPLLVSLAAQRTFGGR